MNNWKVAKTEEAEFTLGKPGCKCLYGRRNDIAYHEVTCPWRIARIQAERESRSDV